jgi:hypothetical protein
MGGEGCNPLQTAVQAYRVRRSTRLPADCLSVKIRNKSVIAQTIIVDIRYCPNMKKYLALVLFTLFAASAFAQPYRHHRHHRHHHPHAVAVR